MSNHQTEQFLEALEELEIRHQAAENDAKSATKYDIGKPQLGLIPRAGLEHEARAFAYGAKKYGKNNYKSGMGYSRLIDATLRHIMAFASGEDLDPESNLLHLGHAKANLSMLLHYIDNKVGTDDR
jgi:Domain of unknown function (DUF5664)